MNFIIIIMSGSVVHAAKSRGQLDILRQNTDLTQFVIEGDFTGRKFGSGFFGSVEEVYGIIQYNNNNESHFLNRLLSKVLRALGKGSSTLQIMAWSSGTSLKCI